MNNLLREYVRHILQENTSLSFRGSGISAENVNDNLQRYFEILKEKFAGETSVEIPVVKLSELPAGDTVVVDSSITRLIGKPLTVKNVVAGDVVVLNPSRLDWAIYEFQGRSGSTWGAAVKDKDGKFVRADSLQKVGFFDTGKANVLQKQNLQEKGLNNSLQEIIAAAGASFAYLSISSRKVMPRIVNVKTITGTPKADVEVVGVTATESVFLSLKDGTTVNDFQQYGGVTPFKLDPQVQEFAYKVWNITTHGGPNKREMPFSEVYTSKVSKNLILATVYGQDAVAKGSSFGLEKCDMLLQGTPESVMFVKTGSKGKIPIVKIVGDGHQLVFPQLPSDEFAPVLLARRDNSTTLSGFGPFTKHQGVRFMCYPKGKMTQKAVEINEALSDIWDDDIPEDVGSKAYN
jgi:hypothetical protein